MSGVGKGIVAIGVLEKELDNGIILGNSDTNDAGNGTSVVNNNSKQISAFEEEIEFVDNPSQKTTVIRLSEAFKNSLRHEGYSETGTRAGGDLISITGDFDSSINGTRSTVDVLSQEIKHTFSSGEMIFSLLGRFRNGVAIKENSIYGTTYFGSSIYINSGQPIKNQGSGGLIVKSNGILNLTTTNQNNDFILISGANNPLSTVDNQTRFGVKLGRGFESNSVHSNFRSIGLLLNSIINHSTKTGNSFHTSLHIDPTINDGQTNHFAIISERGHVAFLKGNVGIDVVSPTEKLEVNGNVKATGFDLSSLGLFADDTAASIGGVGVGFAYINSSTGAMHRRLI